jgi:hypothetical protein
LFVPRRDEVPAARIIPSILIVIFNVFTNATKGKGDRPLIVYVRATRSPTGRPGKFSLPHRHIGLIFSMLGTGDNDPASF